MKHRNSKRIPAMLLALTMLLGTAPSARAAAPEQLSGKAEVVLTESNRYEVTADVTVTDGRITETVLDYNPDTVGVNVTFADNAISGLARKFDNLSAEDAAAIQAVDTVTGATITCDAYKAAILNALGLDKAQTGTAFGTAGIILEPGVYSLPVSLRNASRHESSSNAAGAFPANARLTVREDGTALLETAVEPVTIGPITDMAYDIQYYKADNIDSELFPVTVLETTVKPAPMPGSGKEVPTRISLEIPDNGFDGVYLHFTVDAMGPGYPDAWLKLDYANAKVPGSTQIVEGTAKVDQFGKYTIRAAVSVSDGVITGVDVTAEDFISETHKPENEIRIEQVRKALKNTWNGMAPVQKNAADIFKAIQDKQSPDDVIDSVSGATYSAKAVRDAVMNAFSLEYQEEVIHVPQAVEPGVYQVDIACYSDVVWHSLLENAKGVGTLTVYPDESMSLTMDLKSGTEKEPLYILGFRGTYPGNDLAAELTHSGSTAVMGLSVNDYSDEFFSKGTQVVTRLTMPLSGELDKIYGANFRLYVPAMKALNGEMSGVYFENGTFNVDVFAKIYWDTLKKVSPVSNEEVLLKDPATGVILKTADAKVDYSASLEVSRPYIGQEYTTVRKAMADLGRYWEAYRISLLRDGEPARTGGLIRLAIPMTDAESSLYRIFPDGTRQEIRGYAEDGRYVFDVDALGTFALAGREKTVFTDVAQDYYARDNIDYVVGRGLFAGASHDRFAPNEPMTRAMFVMVLGRIHGVDKTGNRETPFTDVDTGVYYAPYIAWAVENKIAYGTDEDTFDPNASITRQEMAAFLARYCDFAGVTLEDHGDIAFEDQDEISPYAQDEVMKIVRARILVGVEENRFGPGETAVRAQAACLVARFVKSCGL